MGHNYESSIWNSCDNVLLDSDLFAELTLRCTDCDSCHLGLNLWVLRLFWNEVCHYVLKDSDIIRFFDIYTHVHMIINKDILNVDIIRPLNVYSPILTILNSTICDVTLFSCAFNEDGSLIFCRTTLDLHILKNNLSLFLGSSFLCVDNAAFSFIGIHVFDSDIL